ncbi:hypothetical protein ACFVZP_20900, partial [Streptomyces bottropensis]
MSEERPTSDAGRQDAAEEARSAEQDRTTDRVRATDSDAWARGGGVGGDAGYVPPRASLGEAPRAGARGRGTL